MFYVQKKIAAATISVFFNSNMQKCKDLFNSSETICGENSFLKLIFLFSEKKKKHLLHEELT